LASDLKEVRFRLSWGVRGVPIHPLHGPIALEFDARRVVFRYPSKEERAERKAHQLCEAEAVTSAPDEVMVVLAQLAERQLPPVTEPDSAWYRSLFDAAGRIGPGVHIPTRLLPARSVEWLSVLESELADLAFRTVAAARWLANTPSPPWPFDGPHRYCSFDGRTWTELPYEFPPPQWLGLSGDLEAPAIESVRRFVASGGTEPLAHDLLREASVARYVSPRVAVFMAAAAVEIALRDCLSRIPGGSGVWEQKHFDVEKVLSRELPLHPRSRLGSGRVVPGRRLRKKLHRLKDLRDDVAHRGHTQVAVDETDDLIAAASDLVRLVDFYNGRSWALRHLSVGTLQEMAVSTGVTDYSELLALADRSTVSGA